MVINQQAMILRQTHPIELEKVLRFYDRNHYPGGALPSDIILCAEENDEIIGVVRYSVEYGFHMLRGMQVDERFHRQGIGRKLLVQFDKLVGDKICYCIPFRHLIDFYGMIGFKEITLNESPPHLIERLKKYRDDKLDMIVMKRRYPYLL